MYLATVMYLSLNGDLIRHTANDAGELKTYLGLANDVDGLIRILYRASATAKDGTQAVLLKALKDRTLPEE